MLGLLLKSLWSSLNTARLPNRQALGTERPSSVSAFGQVLSDVVAARVHVSEKNNFDSDRWFTKDEAEGVEIALSRGFLSDLVANPENYSSVWTLLNDSYSRDLFVQLLAYRLLGHRHVRLSTNVARHWELREQAKRMHQRPSPSPFSGLFGPLSGFDVDFEGEQIAVDCWWLNVAWTYLFRQYYLHREAVNVAPDPGDRVIDAGACFCDTALAFAASVGSAGSILSFEIDPVNIAVARRNLGQNPGLSRRIQLREEALAHADVPLFRHGSGPGARIASEASPDRVAVTTIDRVVERGEIDRIDFIKMDIEGAERLALAGAVETLRRFRPKLAISLYHRPDDIWTIPLWLESLQLGYRFYLEHYTIHHEETVLYALPDR